VICLKFLFVTSLRCLISIHNKYVMLQTNYLKDEVDHVPSTNGFPVVVMPSLLT